MKIKFNTFILMVLFLTFSFMNILQVSASGSSRFNFEGNSNPGVGENITIDLYVDNITSADGVVSLSGNLSFDSTYLEYVSAVGVSTPYTTQINPANNYRFNGLDISLSNGIKSKTKVLSVTFKTLKEGTTSVSVSNAMMSDKSDKLTVSSNQKTITIANAVSSKSVMHL